MPPSSANTIPYLGISATRLDPIAKDVVPTNRLLRTALTVIVICLASLACSAPAALAHAQAPAQAQTPSETPTIEDVLSRVIPDAMDRLHVPGVVAGAVQNGEVVCLEGFGWADIITLRPMDPASTLVRVGSISKLFVAAAMAREMEAGRLRLDDPVNHHLAAFKLPSVGGQEVTIQHLLTHTAGFDEDVAALTSPQGQPQQSLGSYLGSNIPLLLRPPGQVIQYSNYAFGLAGHVVELTSGQSFRDYVRDNILQPLGMYSSTFSEPEQLEPSQAAQLAQSYHYVRRRNLPTPYRRVNPYPAGSMLSTASDMCRFMLAMLPSGGGGGVVSPESLVQMQSVHFANAPGLPGIGMAWFVGSRNGTTVLSHGGDIWSFSSMLLLVPEHDFGLFVAGNGSGAGSLIDETVTAVFASLFAAPGGPERQGETPGIAHDAAAAQPAFSGTYRLNRYPRRGPAKLSALFMETRVKVSEDGRTVTLLSTPVSKRSPLTAFLRPDGLYQSPEGGELIAFSDPAASGGRSAHMFVGQWAYDRLAWYETGTTWFAAFGACAVAFVVTIAAGLRRALATLRQRSRRRYSMFVSALAPKRNQLSLVPAGLMSAIDLAILVTTAWALAGIPQWQAVAILPAASRALAVATGLSQVAALACLVQVASAFVQRRGRRGSELGRAFASRYSSPSYMAPRPAPGGAPALIAVLAAHVLFTAGILYWRVVEVPVEALEPFLTLL